MNYQELKGKTRLLLLARQAGIGFATAQRFVEEEARVIIFDWNQEGLKPCDFVSAALTAAGLRVDVSSPEQVQAGFQQVDELLGGIDDAHFQCRDQCAQALFRN